MAIKHNANNDCLGEHHKIVVQNNYPTIDLISINYTNIEDANYYIKEYTVAIFKLKPKN
jgi:hypothetical protein